jgi:predicted RNA-binding protein with PUA-like domain
MPRYWLMKTEPESYSIDDLAHDGHTFWNGVRNYQARNFMRDDMKVGDGVLFYHSNADPPAVVGLATVTREGYADHTARDPQSPYFDEKASDDDPRWHMVDVSFAEKFRAPVTLDALRRQPGLERMLVINKSRLSVQPVTPEEWEIVVAMGRAGA